MSNRRIVGARSPICGIGINDAPYSVDLRINGERVVCPFYRRWKSMLGRCYSERSLRDDPTYFECSVSPEWHSFMTFREWMQLQDWRGKHLDKDLLIPGNKVYGPNTCVFISPAINLFIREKFAQRAGLPTGVKLHANTKRIRATCRNPCTHEEAHLGFFDTAEEAHLAWASKKLEFARQLAAQQSDQRIANALISRYSNYESWEVRHER